MGTFYHVLKENSTNEFPRNRIYLDTEANIEHNSDGTQTHTLRLGVACYERTPQPGKPEREQWLNFYSPETFWRWVVNVTEPDRQTLILAYNMGYDARIVAMFPMLKQLGYTQNKLFISQGACILTFRKGKHKITCIDMLNYVTGKLERWGELLGLQKGEVDFNNATDEELLPYCTRDVEILKAVFHQWESFVLDNDLGHFSPTAASQALNAFRHRFMQHKIYIHANKEALNLERDAYTGGRVECFQIGNLENGPFFKLDVNSMYPYVMTKIPVPTKLIGMQCDVTKEELINNIEEYSYVADVVLNTEYPIYPTRSELGTLWKTGYFRASLCEPELRIALENEHIEYIHSASKYEKHIVFDQYIEELYTMRQEYKSQGNEVYSTLTKLLMNSLYGKFGQHSEKWKKIDTNCEHFDGRITVHDDDTGKKLVRYNICGELWELQGKEDSYHSFPAISATITSAARAYLWQLIVLAGLENVFYLDTDCLITNERGYLNLLPQVHPTRLGALKLEEVTSTLILHGPKDYQTDNVKKIKGIPKKAQQITEDTYRTMQWQGLRGAIGVGALDHVTLTPRVKHLARKYKKGNQSSSGLILPFVS